MNIRKFFIAGGNSTALVSDVSESNKLLVARDLLNDVEQVGFISESDSVPHLDMMGGELCVNATLAFAKMLGGSGLLTTCEDMVVSYSNFSNTVGINIPLKYRVQGNVILFDGIGFEFVENMRQVVTHKYLKSMAINYRLPAFGIVKVDHHVIEPWVYVLETNSLVKESTCGSASVGLNILTDTETVIQPTGETIQISRLARSFIVSAQVERLVDENPVLRELL